MTYLGSLSGMGSKSNTFCRWAISSTASLLPSIAIASGPSVAIEIDPSFATVSSTDNKTSSVIPNPAIYSPSFGANSRSRPASSIPSSSLVNPWFFNTLKSALLIRLEISEIVILLVSSTPNRVSSSSMDSKGSGIYSPSFGMGLSCIGSTLNSLKRHPFSDTPQDRQSSTLINIECLVVTLTPSCLSILFMVESDTLAHLASRATDQPIRFRPNLVCIPVSGSAIVFMLPIIDHIKSISTIKVDIGIKRTKMGLSDGETGSNLASPGSHNRIQLLTENSVMPESKDTTPARSTQNTIGSIPALGYEVALCPLGFLERDDPEIIWFNIPEHIARKGLYSAIRGMKFHWAWNTAGRGGIPTESGPYVAIRWNEGVAA